MQCEQNKVAPYNNMQCEQNKVALIVFAHENKQSFNAALKNVAVEELTKQGYHVEVSDLYGQQFEPKNSRQDIQGELQDEKHYSYLREAETAYINGASSLDISTEREKLTRASLVIFQFPLQWFSVPAILKGWFDRILVSGYAFKIPDVYDNGFMKGKRAVLSVTVGSTETMISPKGLHGDMDIFLWPIQYGTLRFCGFDVLRPQLSTGMTIADGHRLQEMLTSWQYRLKTIDDERPIQSIPFSTFDMASGFTLSEKYLKDEEKNKYAPTIGQHLGKQIHK